MPELDNRGDTLIEVLIAISIISLVLASSYGLTTLASRIGIAARERTQAVNFAQAQAEISRTISKKNWSHAAQIVGENDSVDWYFRPASANWEPTNGKYSPPGYGAEYKIWINASAKDINGQRTTNSANIEAIEYDITVTWSSIQGDREENTGVVVRVTKP